MAKRANLILLLLAIIFALLTTLAGWKEWTHLTQARSTGATQHVIVVVKPLAAHTLIDSTDVALRTVPTGGASVGAVAVLSDVVGHYTAGAWYEGQQVLAPMVVNSAAPLAFPLSIPSGLRAVTIPDDAMTGVDHLLSVGDHVDVLTAYSTKQDEGPVSRTVLQDILILAVDNGPAAQTTAAPAPSGNTSSQSSSNTQKADTVTLAVTPQQAQVLDYASIFGQVRLSLRNPSDNRTASVTPVKAAKP